MTRAIPSETPSSRAQVGSEKEEIGTKHLESSGQDPQISVLSPMATVGFLRSLWEKPIWRAFWPYLDPMDSVCVCLRTVSMERAREVRAAWRALFFS